MKEKLLTTIVLGTKDISYEDENVKIISSNNVTNEFISSLNTKYISFINEEDNVDNFYFEKIVQKLQNKDIDCLFINYSLDLDYKKENKTLTFSQDEINRYYPKKDSYLFAYVFKKDLFVNLPIMSEYKEIFKNFDYIKEKIYFHKTKGNILEPLNTFRNRKKSKFIKNIIYIGSYCNYGFNGYSSWLMNIGEIFNNKYEIKVIFTEMSEKNQKMFKDFIDLEHLDTSINYICDNLIVTYSTFYYPLNIYCLNESNMFIHGNMKDFPNARKFTDDSYDHYIAVSKTSKDRAEGYFKTKKIEYILNPYTKNKFKKERPIRLISALRNAPEKGIDRIVKIAKLFDEEDILYTWNVFIDGNVDTTGTTGLFIRKNTKYVEDFIKESDYLVNLSNSEACPYNLIEALANETKVIMTDVEVTHELGLIDGKNGIIIPIDYFKDENIDKLRDKVKEIDKLKDKKFKYDYDYNKFKDYEKVFK